MPEFVAFPKLPRLNRQCQITEKVDGTNACVVIEEVEGQTINGFWVYAQSRKQLITPEKDNQGFARWVDENQDKLIQLLGVGRHYGEWYGSKINGNPYNLDSKRFALFDPLRYEHSLFIPSAAQIGNPWGTVPHDLSPRLGEVYVHTVPLLECTMFHTWVVDHWVQWLRKNGSQLPHLYRMDEDDTRPAEGVVVWHTAARQSFKVTLENDEKPKGSTE
jgi:hypothetical protein